MPRAGVGSWGLVLLTRVGEACDYNWHWAVGGGMLQEKFDFVVGFGVGDWNGLGWMPWEIVGG